MPPPSILSRGVVTGAGQEAPLGDFVAAASTLEPLAEPPLKDPSQWRLIGNPDIRRLDSAIKGNGQAQYAMDVHLPNQMVAMIKRPEQRGALATGFDDRRSTGHEGLYPRRRPAQPGRGRGLCRHHLGRDAGPRRART